MISHVEVSHKTLCTRSGMGTPPRTTLEREKGAYFKRGPSGQHNLGFRVPTYPYATAIKKSTTMMLAIVRVKICYIDTMSLAFAIFSSM